MILIDAGAERGAGAGEKIEVLEQERHAGKGAARESGLNLLARIVIVLDDNGVDVRIDLFGTGDRLIQKLCGAHLTVTNEFGEAQSVKVAVVLERHGASPQSRIPAGPDYAVADKCRRLKSINSRATSSAFSCCTQCPAPSTRWHSCIRVHT